MRTMKVLIVDDEDIIKITLMTFLENMGFIVKGASTAEEAIAKFREECPDVAIVDIRLPDLNGVSLVRRLLKEGCHTLFFFYTGTPDFSVPEDLLKSGRVQPRVFIKPSLIKDIVKEIQKVNE